MHHKGDIASMFQITLLTNDTSSTKLGLNSDIQQLIKEFGDVFAEPKALSPHRQLDHEIHLLPNAAPVNVRPYRYPYF